MASKTTTFLLVLISIASMLVSCGEDQPPMEVSIAEMAQDYLANAYRADEKYDRPLLVSGRVSGVQSSGMLQLMAGGYTHVEADIKSEDDLLSLNRGDRADLRCDGAQGSSDTLGAFIYLEGCELYEEVIVETSPLDREYEQQLAEGKSAADARTYAFVYTELTGTLGKSEEYARHFADFGGKFVRGQPDIVASMYAQMRVEGKTHEDASTYAEDFREIPPGASKEYVDAYIQARADGKAQIDALFYADKISSGRHEFLNAYDKALSEGESEEYAHAYALKIEQGRIEIFARSYAEVIGTIRAEGKDERYAIYYAYKRSRGKTKLEASTYPDFILRIPPGSSDILVTVYVQLREQGRDHDEAFPYADALARQIEGGHSLEFAEAYTQGYLAGLSDVEARHFAEQIENGKSLEYAVVYAQQRAKGKSHEEAAELAENYRP